MRASLQKAISTLVHHITSPAPASAQTCFSSIPAPISNLAPVLALTSSSVAPGISSIRVIFPAFRSISKTACVAS
jgi:hypothetical protein